MQPLDPGPAPEHLRIDALADVLASLPDDAVLSHRSAAAVWGLWIPAFDGVEITSPAGPRGSRYTTGVQRLSVSAHRRLLAPHHVTSHLGLPVTTVARTWLDLAALGDIYDLVAAGDSALRAGLPAAELAQLVRDARRLRGLVRARGAVPLLDARSRSRPESRIRSALELAGLPRPRVNEAIYDAHHGWLAEPDLHYREARLALEYNGADHANLDRMRKDSTRLLDLQRAGWEVRTYTVSHAFRRLDEVVADVRGLLDRRAPQLLAATALDRRVTYLQDQRRRSSRL
jgi:hypothetical protein